MSRIAFRNFTGGEVTPTLSARYDLQKFGTFLQSCENFIPNLHGDIERRPGIRFLASLDGPAVLVPFQFNTEPENNYVLIFMSGKILVADETACFRRKPGQPVCHKRCVRSFVPSGRGRGVSGA